jgi:electron transfer flavoprotein beta subunit
VRNLEDRLEVVTASLPVVVTVISQINKPRIPALTQILRAGKKPLTEWKIPDVGVTPADLKNEITLVSNLAPVQQRKQVLFNGDVDDNVNNLVNALIKDGVQGR